MGSSRRFFLKTSALTSAALEWPFPAFADQENRNDVWIGAIEKVVLDSPAVPGGTWFHPRACMANGLAIMTLQTIKGSDFFGPVHWTESRDLGRTWRDFRPIPSLGWVPQPTGGFEGVCDVTPAFHPGTQSILALGHNVFYQGDRFDRNQPPRWPIYAVWRDGVWGPRRKLEWDDPRGSYIYTNGCGQRVMLPNGDIAMSFTFGVRDKPRSVSGVLCSFDGDELKVKDVGNVLQNKVGRGLLEPSVTFFQSRFYMTIRAEDNRGYVAVSDDGLHYEPQVPWTWNDGQILEMSTTQQHWLNHSQALFLVYTRKDTTNTHVSRWRAPLWIAQVDLASMRLIRSTEQIVLPLVGDGVQDGAMVPLMGNFGINHVSPFESWVTDGSWSPKANNSGELQLARIRWNHPNDLEPSF